MKRQYHSLLAFIIMAFLFSGLPAATAIGMQAPERSNGQMIYVPAYSHIYHGNKEAPLLLSVTVSIRNVDPEHSITITNVSYYETQGKLIKNYLEKPLVLAPLGSERYVVPQRDTSGGSGANFIVEWKSEQMVNPPITETVMIGTQSQLGISFTSRGQVISN